MCHHSTIPDFDAAVREARRLNDIALKNPEFQATLKEQMPQQTSNTFLGRQKAVWYVEGFTTPQFRDIFEATPHRIIGIPVPDVSPTPAQQQAASDATRSELTKPIKRIALIIGGLVIFCIATTFLGALRNDDAGEAMRLRFALGARALNPNTDTTELSQQLDNIQRRQIDAMLNDLEKQVDERVKSASQAN